MDNTIEDKRTISSHKNNNSYLMVSSIISFLLISYALVALLKNLSGGHELSIYHSTNLTFWIAITIGLLNGFFCLYECIYGKNGMWPIGIIQIIFCNILIILLPKLRGYLLLNRSDVLGYIGQAMDISMYGEFFDNIYPITSILASQINQITGLTLVDVSYCILIVFFMIYNLSIYCLAKTLKADRKFTLATFISSIPIFYSGYLVGMYYMLLAVLTIPIFFYFLQKRLDLRFRLLTAIICMIFPFFHPIIAAILIIFMISIYISSFYSNCDKRLADISSLFAFYSTLFMGWFSIQYILIKSANSIILQVWNLSRETSTSAVEAQYYLNTLGLIHALHSFLLMQFDEIIFYILSIISIYYIISSKNSFGEYRFIPVVFCFITGNLFLIMMFFFTRMHGPDRLINLNFNMVLTPLFLGYLIYRFCHHKNKLQVKIILILILFSAFTAGISIYPSPIISKQNDQLISSELIGAKWLLSQKDLKTESIGLLSIPYRYAEILLGEKAVLERKKDLPMYFDPFPDHFGFSNDTQILESDKNKYLVITGFDIQAYTEVWKSLHRFMEDDFARLNYSENIDSIYQNGYFLAYYIHKR